MLRIIYILTAILLWIPFLVFSQNEHQILLKRYFESLKVTPKDNSGDAQLSKFNTTLDWSIPELVCSDRTNPQMPSICLYFNDMPHLVWMELNVDTLPEQANIYYSKKDTTGWQIPTNLSNNCEGGIYPRIVTFRKILHVLWRTSVWINQDPNQKMFWIKYDGYSWSNPEEIANGIWLSNRKAVVDKSGWVYLGTRHIDLFGEKDGLYLTYYNGKLWNSHKIDWTGSQVNLFIDNEQKIHRVWVKAGSSKNSDVWYAFSADSGKTWQSTKEMFSGEGYSHYPMIVVDQQGVRHVVWQEDVNLNIFPDAIYYSSSSNGRDWLNKKTIAGPHPYDSILMKEICIDSEGTVHVVWNEGEFSDLKLYYLFGKGQNWSEKELIIGDDNMSVGGYFSVVIDNSDRLHLSFMCGGSIYYTYSEPVTSKVYNTEQAPHSPANFVLHQNYPNPFNPETTISYSLPTSDYVTIKIYDITGREIRTLVNERKASGYYNIQWDGKDKNGIDAASGIYIYNMKTSSFSQCKKMILVR